MHEMIVNFAEPRFYFHKWFSQFKNNKIKMFEKNDIFERELKFIRNKIVHFINVFDGL